MKIIFSDYDGTIKPFFNNPNIFEKITFKKNLSTINKFIDNGNQFVITTGRSTNSILEEIKRYKINFSYLSTYDGRVTFDNNLNLLNSKKISKEVLLELKKIIENEKIVKRATIYDEYGKIYEINEVVLMSIKPKSINELQRILKSLFEYENSISIIPNFLHKEIVVAPKSNKVDGARFLIEKNNWNIKDVCSVGDSKNDLELLTEYDGYRMLFSHNCLLMPVENVTTSVHKLIKKID